MEAEEIKEKIRALRELKESHPPDEKLIDNMIEMYEEQLKEKTNSKEVIER